MEETKFAKSVQCPILQMVQGDQLLHNDGVPPGRAGEGQRADYGSSENA